METTSIEKHWNQAWSQEDVTTITASRFPHDRDETHRFFAQRLQQLSGERVLEVGCGEGQMAVYMAKQGARVTAVDISSKAVQMTRANAHHNDVEDRVSARQLDALKVAELSETFDLVVGRFILHHIEPFSAFVEKLDSVLAPTGRGLFLENSARNRLLMLFRNHVTGRFGIPKYGDDEEHPLTQQEIRRLRSTFDVEVHRPELVLFKKLNTYLIGYDNGFDALVQMIEAVDDTLHRLVPPLRKYSYLQVLDIRK